MPARKGLLAPQNTFLDTIATRFDGTHSNFVLGNAKIAKVYPIVYCSDGFCDLSGYSRAQIMQKSCACNFLYGQKTDVQHREAISRALEQKLELKLEVILYKSSGTPFWCLLDIVPIQDEKHEVVLFLCSHKDITKQKLHEQQQQQLQQLHARKQQQIAASAAEHQLHQAATAGSEGAPEHTGGDADSAQVADNDGADSATGADQQPDMQHLNTAELTALANQNALLSMDEFQLDDSAGEGDFYEDDNLEDQDKHTANQYSRRRSRAVLYQLSGHYGYGNRRNVNMKSKLKLNNRINLPEYKTTTIEKQRFILSHYGVGKSCWDWLILVVSFYVAIVVPYNATFKDKKQETGECQIDSIDVLVEVVFVIDVILNFRTTFVNRKGEVVTQPMIICKHYVRGWFVVDACAALPFDLLCELNLYSRSRLDLNLLKLIRLLRLARLLQKMDRYSQYSYIILTLLMLIFSLLAHWCACIWYVIAMEEIERNPPDWKIGWIHQLSDKLGYSVVNTTDMASSYVTALYFTTSSLTSVGFGNVSANTNAEKIFSIVIMLIGALMHAVVFGNVTALIRVMYARRSNYQTRLRDLKDFFRLHQLPKELQQRMSDYFQTTWSLNHGIETYEMERPFYLAACVIQLAGQILKDFPEELRGDVSLHLHREVLSLPIFETAPQGFLKSLARHIESKFCCPTEYLIHRGDALNYLYLVCNGSMEVLQSNMVVAILGKGDLVGYDVNSIATPEHTQYGLSSGGLKSSALLAGPMGLVKSGSDLKALTYCDLKCIHIGGLLEVLKLYPEFSDTFHEEIMHDLSFNLREMGKTDELGDEEDLMDGQGGGNASATAALTNNPEEDDEPEDSEDDERRPPNGGRGRRHSGRRRSPPPPPSGAAGGGRHLYRAATEEHQIGRYDADELDEDAEDEDDGDEGGLEVEEDEEEEEEDEEEDEELDEAEVEADEEDSDNRPPDGDAGGGVAEKGPEPSDRQPEGTARQLSPQSSDEIASSRGQIAGGGAISTNHCSPLDRVSLSVETLTASTTESQTTHATPTANGQSPTRGGQLRRRVCRRVAQEDWHSSHSYDGCLVDSSRRRQKSLISGSVDGNGNSAPVATTGQSLSRKNRSHEAVRVADSSESVNGGAVSGTARRLRPAIGKAGQAAGGRKPPLSFDLSRNTTALIDRRRSSAGCIPRPLVGVAAGAAANRHRNHSSLIHINEEQPLAAVSNGAGAGGGTRRSASSRPQVTGNCSARTTPASFDLCRSSQELRTIEARLSGVSANMQEMKLELRRELNHFRSAMQLLLQEIANRQVFNGATESGNALAQSTGSLVSARQSPLATSASINGGRGREPATPIARSHSASSLSGICGQLAGSLRSLRQQTVPTGTLLEESELDTDNLRQRQRQQQQQQQQQRRQVGGGRLTPLISRNNSGATASSSDKQPVVMRRALSVASKPSSCTSGAQVSLLSQPVGQSQVVTCTQQQQHLFVTQTPLRPVSQGSSATSPSAGQQLHQSSSGVNLNNSDNDSGRSSSSTNSPGGNLLRAGANNQSQQQQSRPLAVLQSGSGTAAVAADYHLQLVEPPKTGNAVRTGRAATVVVSQSARTGGDETEMGLPGYCIADVKATSNEQVSLGSADELAKVGCSSGSIV